MPEHQEYIVYPDLDEIDPDRDGLPGITADNPEYEKRLKEFVTKLKDIQESEERWYYKAYLFLLEFGNNLGLLIPGVKHSWLTLLLKGAVEVISWKAKRTMVKEKKLKK